MKIDIESEALDLHGGYDRVLGVFARGEDVYAILGGAFLERRDFSQVAVAVGILLPRMAEEMGVPFPVFMATLTAVALKGVPYEELRDVTREAEDAEAVRALADELGVEVPE